MRKDLKIPDERVKVNRYAFLRKRDQKAINKQVENLDVDDEISRVEKNASSTVSIAVLAGTGIFGLIATPGIADFIEIFNISLAAASTTLGYLSLSIKDSNGNDVRFSKRAYLAATPMIGKFFHTTEIVKGSDGKRYVFDGASSYTKMVITENIKDPMDAWDDLYESETGENMRTSKIQFLLENPDTINRESIIKLDELKSNYRKIQL